MTPEERDLVRDLFVRLAELERERRDPDAERLIREGLARAPNAIYSLVQTVLLQDEGLRAANDHIVALQDEAARAQQGGQQQSGGSFLGDKRGSGGGSKWNTGDVIGGGPAPQSGGGGSVPRVGGSGQPMGAPPGFNRDGYRDDRYGGPGGGQQYGGPPGGAPPYGGSGAQPYGGPGGQPYGGPGGEPPRGGAMGGFLGTAAAVAAGAIGGSLLMGGIRSALGGQGGKGPASGALDHLAGKPPGGAAGGELSRDAGLNDVGRTPTKAAAAEKDEDEDDDEKNEDDDSGDDEIDHDQAQNDFDDQN
jgi:hypothetical protein